MLDRHNQGPQCTACGSPMKLIAIEPSDTGRDLRSFACPVCKRVQQHLIESAVTEAWLEPQIVIRARDGSAVTYEVHGGRMILKRA